MPAQDHCDLRVLIHHPQCHPVTERLSVTSSWIIHVQLSHVLSTLQQRIVILTLLLSFYVQPLKSNLVNTTVFHIDRCSK